MVGEIQQYSVSSGAIKLNLLEYSLLCYKYIIFIYCSVSFIMSREGREREGKEKHE